jgi:hypothetical protein
MISDNVMRGIKEYVHKYRSTKDTTKRENISREVGQYLSHVTQSEQEFLFYASEYVCRCHEHTMLERLKMGLEDWI